MSGYRYKVEFLTPIDSKASTYAPAAGDAMEGFWINDKWHFTKGSDSSYWIPPSRILFIFKEPLATDD